MSLLVFVLGSAAILIAGYLGYGRLLSRLLDLDNRRPTPAVELRDDVDFEPTSAPFLMGQHFSAIAAAGPIVGPILAGLAFGWLPALLWILIGSIFIGGVHDMTSLVASIRHRAQSITEVVREHVSRRAYLLFLTFVWIALVYIIVAFTDITARSFVGRQTLENQQTVLGAGIAMSSLLYLLLPVAMGLAMKYLKLGLIPATLIFVPLIGVSIWAGQKLPLDLESWFGLTEGTTVKLWSTLLLIYCLVAAMVPVWLLLQPRGYLGGFFLYAALLGGALGLSLGNNTVQYPAFIAWTNTKGEQLFPFLFITIACGACSGFHSLISSGTTSKQLARESDARPIGYGTMLLEAMVAVISLCCVMMFAQGAPEITGKPPNLIYAMGMANFVEAVGVPVEFAVSFALLAFTTFVYDTLDVCARLGRFIIQELTGLQGALGRWLGTGLTVGVPLLFLWNAGTDAAGKPVEIWKVFWSLFGASNQLLAALALLGVTVWLWRTRRQMWVWLVVGLPTLWMYVMRTWALGAMILPKFQRDGEWIVPSDIVAWVGLVLMALAALMLVETLLAMFGQRSAPPPTDKRAAIAT
ncbi:MAG: carbon starvation protein A [Planctomycetota bacterium]